MTPRERILAAFEHRQPDRVPIDFSGHRSSGITAVAYLRLRAYLGLPEVAPRVYDPIQQLAIVDEDVLERFGVDTIEVGRGCALADTWWGDWTLPDGSPCQMPVWALPERGLGEWVMRSRGNHVMARLPDGAWFFEQAYYPFADPEAPQRVSEAMEECMWNAIATPPGPLGEGREALARLFEGGHRLRQNTDKAILGLVGASLFEQGQFLYGNDNFFALLAGEPAKAHALLDEVVELHLQGLEKFLGEVGDCIDIVVFGDDLGMQTGPMISPAMYREFFKLRHSVLWKRAKELANVKVMLHSCGGIRELLPDLIEAGLDAVNPVQITAAGMGARELKAEFGKDLVFWGGGCDTQEILPRGTAAAVRQHVKEQVEILSAGGGFVFQQVHNILPEVPPENVVAMFEAVNEGGS